MILVVRTKVRIIVTVIIITIIITTMIIRRHPIAIGVAIDMQVLHFEVYLSRHHSIKSSVLHKQIEHRFVFTCFFNLVFFFSFFLAVEVMMTSLCVFLKIEHFQQTHSLTQLNVAFAFAFGNETMSIKSIENT